MHFENGRYYLDVIQRRHVRCLFSGMKRNLALLVFCAVAILGLVLLISSRRPREPAGGSPQSLVVVTQDGRVTVAPQQTNGSVWVVGHVSATTNSTAGAPGA